MDHRLGVDIGGTFTDVALDSAGRRYTAKVLTTPAAPERGVIAAIEAVLAEARIPAAALSIIIHGTTLATNALIERKGAKTALITTRGFRDTIEIRHENRFEQYDVGIDLPPPLVPRRLRLTVSERIDARGRVLTPLDEDDVTRAIDEIEHQDVKAVAVGLLHSFTEPRHERRIGAMIAQRLPGVAVTLSSEVSPEMREYERFSTACANAYLQPLIATYLANLRRDLDGAGVRCPLFLMLSGGGLTTVETAIRFPVRLVESGPAGGAIFASHIARQRNLDQVISFDMGGTTAKICLIDEFKPQSNRVFEVARIYRFKKGSGLPLRIPVIEMVEIGAGGGSIARVDRMKRIAVGPDSAGAAPGPACYGAGGTEPTVTDADVVLGRIDPDAFSGGRMRLDIKAAQAAIQNGVGQPLDLSPTLAALGLSEMVDENMSNAARVHAIECGKDARGRVLIAFGGAAPLHAARVAEKLGMDRILVPTGAGVGSAIGFLRAPIAYEIVRSRLQTLARFNAADANALYAEMRAEAEGIVRRGAPHAPLEEERHAFMRYRGQGHEVMVPLPVARYGENDGARLAEAFAAAYRALYSRTIPGVDIEVVSWALSLRAPVDLAIEAPLPAEPYKPQPTGRRPLFDAGRGETIEVDIYRRADLRPGAQIAGPALIVEDETSTVVSPAFDASVDGYGYIELRRRGT
ncbi:MAG: hydantoinase/oxoprolinase family protein [Hyphomicrobiales bacterium]|nr:hydantoinase/oxoprolinase family protein [Hyphomicrobiales bacterium]MBV8827473.1 hydantoinase/oxoprolinase family protein [Hyphomicrobiales bacterium]